MKQDPSGGSPGRQGACTQPAPARERLCRLRRQGFPAFSARRGLVAAPGRCKGSKPVRGPVVPAGPRRAPWEGSRGGRGRDAPSPAAPREWLGSGPVADSCRCTHAPICLCTDIAKYRYGFIALSLYRDAPIYRYTYMPSHRCTHVPICPRTDAPSHPYIVMPVHRYPDTSRQLYLHHPRLIFLKRHTPQLKSVEQRSSPTLNPIRWESGRLNSKVSNAC